jgi:hypothetical protein
MGGGESKAQDEYKINLIPANKIGEGGYADVYKI